MKTRWIVTVIVTLSCLVFAGPVFASMFGEENTTLASILSELISSGTTLSDVSHTADQMAGTVRDVSNLYQKANAAIDRVRNYSFDEFLSDLKNDFSREYPGFVRLEDATANFDRWQDTRSTSPVTAYRAISAVAADISQPLRDDLNANRTNIDRELVLASQAATGFATAQTADEVNDSISKRIAGLSDEAQSASPGRAQQLTAQATFILLAQQSQMMRLLSQMVRADSAGTAVEYGRSISARNAIYAQSDALTELEVGAVSATALVDFGAE